MQSWVYLPETIGKGKVVGGYYETQMYVDPYKNWHKTKSYREVVMQMTTGTSWKWTNRLTEKFIENNRIEHKVWIVPALFLAMRFTNHVSYLPGEATLETKG